MKKILLTLFLTFCMVVGIYGQFDSGYPSLVRGNSGLEILIEATMDTTSGDNDSLVTEWYDISDFDGTLEYTQLYSLIEADGTDDTVSVLIDLYGNESPSWTGAVSITQILDTTTSSSATYTASTLSNKRPKYISLVLENKPMTEGANLNADDSVDVHVVFRLPIKDAKIIDE